MKDKLNKEQEHLTRELDKNLILIAPAGTGKTETLSHRIGNIIKNKKAICKEILCITFTNRACKEMKSRVENLIGSESSHITIKTFHSFCLSVIKEQAKKNTDIFTDFTVIDEEDMKSVIEKFNKNAYSINSLRNFINMVKDHRTKVKGFLSENEDFDYKKVIQHIFSNYEYDIDKICTVEGKVDTHLKSVLENYGHILIKKYNLELKKCHMLDFCDLIMEVNKLFKDDKVVNQYRDRYKYINIDEVQDTSLTEFSIIEKIFGNNNILLSGDRFQTIYGWRGSAPSKIMESFKKNYNPTVIEFTKNYRATKLLTKASVDYLKKAFPSEYRNVYMYDMESMSAINGEKIDYKSYPSREEEAYGIKKSIDEIYNNNINPGSMCILTRNNYINIELSSYLKNSSNKYKFVLVDEYKFFRREEIKDVLAFLKLIVNKNDSLSLERILKKFAKGIGDTTIKTIQCDEYRKLGIKLTDFIEENLTGEYFSLLLDTYYTNEPIVVFDVESTGVDVTEDEIVQIAAIKIDNEGEIIEKFERFIRPGKSLGNSSNIHGFTEEFLCKNGQDKISVFNDFLEFTKDALIVGHNVNYDVSILKSELERLNMQVPRFKGVYDTLDIYRRFYPNLINHKLETLSKEFPIKHIPTHNALDDVKATSYLLVYAIKNKIQETSLNRISIMAKYKNKFHDISMEINRLIHISSSLRPYEIINYILYNFNFNSIYDEENREKKLKYINDFKDFSKLYDDEVKNCKDQLIDIVNLTSLSNGEIEEVLIQKTGIDRIPIITVHQAKGLEFDYVFLAGLEQNTFPTYQSLISNNISEEKRLFYVAMTRAKKRLFLSNSNVNKWGKKTYGSEFIKDINITYL